MPPTVIEALRLSNARVRELMTRLQPTAGDAAVVSRQDFDALREELGNAALWLRGVSPGSLLETELAKEIADYRSSLEQLQQMLPAIEQRLLTKKARLQAERTHWGAAADWANASRNTL
jgi:hypothetical protein